MRLFVTGDTHGEIDIHKLSGGAWKQQNTLTREDLLIVLGDFGFIWSNEPDGREQYWLDWFAKKPFRVAFIDGNHENHPRLAAFPEEEFHGGCAGRVGENVWHLKRGEIFQFESKKIFVMGGALSIDKMFRREGISWWAEEIPSAAEEASALEHLEQHNWQVDYILTHTLPRTIITRNFTFPRKEQDPTTEFLDQIWEAADFKGWYGGHFHIDVDVNRFHLLYQRILEVELT